MYVHVNAAQSVDGKLSTHRREQVAISGPADFDRVDRLRAAADAVMVGVGTVLADDPALTVKEEDRRVQRLRSGRPANPARVVADSRARTPTDARILDGDAKTYVLTSRAADDDAVSGLEAAGASVLVAGEERVDLGAALLHLGDDGVDRLMVEGGGELIFSLFADDLVDRLTLYVGSTVFGGRDAPTLVDGEGFADADATPRLDLTDVDRLDDGVVLDYDVLADV